MLPLEDSFTDIISKAQYGIGLDDSAVVKAAGISEAAFMAVKCGVVDEEVLCKIGPVLHVHVASLISLAKNEWYPSPIHIDGLLQCTTLFGEMAVNAYLVWDTETRAAAVFDTGSDSSPLLKAAQDRNLSIRAVFITHTHSDHVSDIERLLQSSGLDQRSVYSCHKEPVSESTTFRYGAVFSLDHLTIETRPTFGHSIGGVSYVITGLSNQVAIVGDALFAGSMGRGNVSWERALATNRSELLTLSADTVICPGHGPLTTIGQEKDHNPFFPEFK